MQIIQVEDSYIELLRKKFPHVMDPKRFHRSHTRKYVGVIFVINSKNYYAPFSSPKKADYDSFGNIKKSDMFSIRMVKNGENGQKKLLGTIRLNCMVPVPMIYIVPYDYTKDPDFDYGQLVADEFKFIQKNQNLITQRAMWIYNFKNNEIKNINAQNKKQYEAILPFKDIENFLDQKKLK